ncbi:Alg9-like mannosyltransferase [Martensiomyces pterosporus]|nr:Alg9-like mannosyltransferase [Martensiomyces pterosporus]
MWRPRSIYAALVVARLLLSISPAYIHPDEFFQAPEVVSSDVFGLDALHTWEFTSKSPVRSIVPIYLYSGTPMVLLKCAQHALLKFGVQLELTSTLIFCTTRLFMALLTFVVDCSIYSTIRRINSSARLRPTMLLLASSHCLAVFHAHTFSNSFSSIVLAVCFNILSRIEQGCSARAADVHIGAAPFRVSGSLTCTVLNNYFYNKDSDNLATHGIHPWYEHSLISMPALFGPLYMLAAIKAWRFIKSPSARQGASYTSVAAALSVMSGLVMLSAVPHQEVRFLLPVLPGIIICTSRWHRLAPPYFWHLWTVFNALLAVGYGVVHQSGVVPVLRYLSETSVSRSAQCYVQPASEDAICKMSPDAYPANSSADGAGPQLTTHVLFFAAYMAPRHLLVQPNTKPRMQSRVELVDLVSKTDSEVRDAIRQTFFVMPASVDMERILPRDSAGYELLPVYSFAPHVNFDHVLDVLQHPLAKARLDMFLAAAR